MGLGMEKCINHQSLHVQMEPQNINSAKNIYILAYPPKRRREAFQLRRSRRLIETCDPLGRSEQIKYLRHWALPAHVTDGALEK
ncbi:hypothetical protein D3C81_1638590 [compost metagenome]